MQDANSDFCQAVHRNPATGGITVPFSLDVLPVEYRRARDLAVSICRCVTDSTLGKSRFDMSTLWTWTEEFT